jgi:hypothetical protein
MSEDPKPQKKGFGWGRLLKWCGLGALLFSVLLVASFVILVMHEFMLAGAPPAPAQTTAKLLIKHEPPTKAQANPSSAPRAKDAATSATQATGAVSSLSFEPFIPDTPDLPAALRAKRDLLNARFDRIMQEIDAYERLKTGKWKIYKDYEDAWNDVLADCGPNHPIEGGFKELSLRNLACVEWQTSLEMDGWARRQDWDSAARDADYYIRLKQDEWSMRTYIVPQHIFMSDYYRDGGMADWRRQIFYYRQQGGWGGYSSIVSSVYHLEKKQFVDYIHKKTLAIVNPSLSSAGAGNKTGER